MNSPLWCTWAAIGLDEIKYLSQHNRINLTTTTIFKSWLWIEWKQQIYNNNHSQCHGINEKNLISFNFSGIQTKIFGYRLILSLEFMEKRKIKIGFMYFKWTKLALFWCFIGYISQFIYILSPDLFAWATRKKWMKRKKVKRVKCPHRNPFQCSFSLSLSFFSVLPCLHYVFFPDTFNVGIV